MSIDPRIYADYREAKKAAAILASACGATLLQNEHGKPRVILGKMVKDFPTWLAVWSWLHQVRKDQLGSAASTKPPAVVVVPPSPAPKPPIPVAKLAPPLKNDDVPMGIFVAHVPERKS